MNINPGTDAVILSTKYGKSKVIYAKIISSLLFGTVTFVMNCTIALLLPLLTFGVEGGNLPLQIMDSYCPYALNFSQAAFIVIGIAYFVMLGLLAITLLCSSKMKSSCSFICSSSLFLCHWPIEISKDIRYNKFGRGNLTPL